MWTMNMTFEAIASPEVVYNKGREKVILILSPMK